MFSSMKGALGLGSPSADLTAGLQAPLPFPGFYETVFQPTDNVLWPKTFGRSVKVVVGNPINDSFGTQFELKLDGSAMPQQAVMQQQAQGHKPTRRTRHFRAGGYFRSAAQTSVAGAPVSTFQALLDQSGYVHARGSQAFGDRVKLVMTGSASRQATPNNSFTSRVMYRGDTFSATVRAQSVFHDRDMYSLAGVSAMKQVTRNLSVAGEIYADAGRYARNFPQWIQYSASGIWKQSDWMAAATMSTIPVRQAQAVLFLTYARKLGSTATLASQILIRQSDHWSRVKVGGEMVMPHSKSRMQFSYDTQGTMQTVWERRLLSNVRLQVTGELNLFSFKQTNPQSPAFYGNRFGLCLHIGSIPKQVSSSTPLLRVCGYERDIPEQR